MKIPYLTPLLGNLINFLYSITSNYMIALILFALFMKLVLFPLGIKQQKNSVKQASLRPKEMAIRKRYAGRTDEATKKKLNEEIMKLYQDEQYNPASGCLPLLIQLPILYSLYYVITNPIEYILRIPLDIIAPFKEKAAELLGRAVHNQIDITKMIVNPEYSDAFAGLFSANGAASAGFTLGRVQELHSNFQFLGLNLLDVPSLALNWLIFIPILTFVFSFISTKTIRKFTYQPATEQAKTMAFMDWTMPLFSVWISLKVSAAVGIYWMAQNVLGAVQQVILYKMYPIPNITEEQIREAELALKGKGRKPEKSGGFDEDLPSAGGTKGKKKKQNDRLSLRGRGKGVSRKARKLYRQGKRLKARKKI